MRESFGQAFAGAYRFLDTATIGLPTVAAAAQMRLAVDRWETGGWGPADFVAPAESSNAAFAELTGTSVHGITQGGSVSGLVGLFATSVPDGTRVLVRAGEYSSLTYPFLAHAHRQVTVTEVADDDLAARAGAYDIVAVSAVQSADGVVTDLEALRLATRDTSTQVIVDVTQAAGWADLQLDWADAVVGAAYKWLLGWRGLAWMWSPEPVHSTLLPTSANWSAGADRWASNYGAHMVLADDARRLDSSPPWFAQLAAAQTMPWLASLDRQAVAAHCVRLANRLRDAAALPRCESPIVLIPTPELGPRLREQGYRVAARQSGVRLSFHLYNTDDDVDGVIDLLRESSD